MHFYVSFESSLFHSMKGSSWPATSLRFGAFDAVLFLTTAAFVTFFLFEFADAYSRLLLKRMLFFEMIDTRA